MQKSDDNAGASPALWMARAFICAIVFASLGFSSGVMKSSYRYHFEWNINLPLTYWVTFLGWLVICGAFTYALERSIAAFRRQ